MNNKCLITTPIYYVNAKPHLGHLYTSLNADVLSRFYNMQNLDTFLLTGTDEHGDKIVAAAKKENLSTNLYVDKISQLFKELLPKFNIKPNYFIRTTHSKHISLVSSILQRLYDKGDIFFNEYEGLYCFGCERFYQERELINGKICPDHQTELQTIREANYFFAMSKYQDFLINHIKKNPDFIQPEQYRKEVLTLLDEPLEDLCISRPKTRLDWGITLPFDNNYVTYVWFDALLNYVSALDYPDGELFDEYWGESYHIIAKDIMKPHAIYWPTILKAAGIPLYKKLLIHGYWNVDKTKMSKSLNNVVSPLDLLSRYSVDAIRFFLMREMSFGHDSNFSEDALLQRNNSDLANDLGNLLSRTISMTHKYFNGVIPDNTNNNFENTIRDKAMETVEFFESNMETLKFHKALISIWEFISVMNKYIDEKAPWSLAKDETKNEELSFVIYNLLEGLRVISGLIYPFMPRSSRLIQDTLGQDCLDIYYDLDCLKDWNGLISGTRVNEAIKLFPRIE